MSIDEITHRVADTLPTENKQPSRVVIAWHVRHSPYFVKAGMERSLPPKKQPARATDRKAA